MHDMPGDALLGYGHGDLPSLGHEYLLTDSGQLLQGAAAIPTTGTTTHSLPGSPLSTLVGTAGGLEIDLMWDPSVRSASDWSAIESAVTTAAKIFTSAFSNPVVVNIAVGFGEIDGSSLEAGALGESDSSGYIVNYSTAETALAGADAALFSGHGSNASALAESALSHANFYIASAEAKALDLVNGTSTAIDGYIGLSKGASLLYFPAAGGTIKSSQYDAIGVAAHEISEVMGRIGMQGQTLGSYSHVYTPLDLMRFSGSGVPALSAGAGYFSINGGKTSLNTYNNPANGGDGSDWASLTANRTNSFDAFANPGVTTTVTVNDMIEVAALGYKVASGVTLHATTA